MRILFIFYKFCKKAVLGYTFDVKTLYGMKQIIVEKGTQHGQKIKLPNYVIIK